MAECIRSLALHLLKFAWKQLPGHLNPTYQLHVRYFSWCNLKDTYSLEVDYICTLPAPTDPALSVYMAYHLVACYSYLPLLPVDIFWLDFMHRIIIEPCWIEWREKIEWFHQYIPDLWTVVHCPPLLCKWLENSLTDVHQWQWEWLEHLTVIFEWVREYFAYLNVLLFGVL